MKWFWRFFSHPRRRLFLSTSGKWYVLMTIAIGVVALSSGNNVLYLMESFLLGGLILSGVLSEKAITSLDIKWRRSPAIAGEPTIDHFIVVNNSKLPIFCVDIGEWKDDEFIFRGFVPYIGARSKVRVPCNEIYPTRGYWNWKGIGIATRFPFGFAKKVRWVLRPGHRTIWPSRNKRQWPSRMGHMGNSKRSQAVQVNSGGAGNFVEGEIRPMVHGDDYRQVVWSISLQRGEPVVRIRGQERSSQEVTLDLNQIQDQQIEETLSQVAEVFYRSSDGDRDRDSGVLVVLEGTHRRRIQGAQKCLDYLATLRQSSPDEEVAA